MERGKSDLSDPLADRFVGSLLGLLVGDALGAPVEGLSGPEIRHGYGRLERMVPGRLPAGSYTDDGQMALGLLESLVAEGRFDPARCAARWLAGFDPARGYGGRIERIMARLAAGEEWSTVGTDSFGNGPAMRVGPLGAWFFRDREELVRAARVSASITHRHPQGLAGAVVQGLAVGSALAAGLAGEPLRPIRFLGPLIQEAGRIDPETARRLENLGAAPFGDPEGLSRFLSRNFACDVRAIESVGPALGAVLGTGSFKEAVVLAVNLGGDADTLGAMAGAVAGAYHGFSRIPAEWLEALENGPRGRDYAIALGREGAAMVKGFMESGKPF